MAEQMVNQYVIVRDDLIEFQHTQKCGACQQRQRPCMMKREDESCILCADSGRPCIFERNVRMLGPANRFSWEYILLHKQVIDLSQEQIVAVPQPGGVPGGIPGGVPGAVEQRVDPSFRYRTQLAPLQPMGLASTPHFNAAARIAEHPQARHPGPGQGQSPVQPRTTGPVSTFTNTFPNPASIQPWPAKRKPKHFPKWKKALIICTVMSAFRKAWQRRHVRNSLAMYEQHGRMERKRMFSEDSVRPNIAPRQPSIPLVHIATHPAHRENQKLPKVQVDKLLPKTHTSPASGFNSGEHSAKASPSAIRRAATDPNMQRPHRALTCPQCNTRPQGFRSEHELKRHTEREHVEKRKMWVCVDKSENGNFLADCESCQKGKAYSADYNAAAHLRRKHFVAKPKGRGKSSRSSELRGGKSGGAFPPMDVLKQWMKEVEVDIDTEYVGDSSDIMTKEEDMDETPSPSKKEARKRSLEEIEESSPVSPNKKMHEDTRMASEDSSAEVKASSTTSPAVDDTQPSPRDEEAKEDVKMEDAQVVTQAAAQTA